MLTASLDDPSAESLRDTLIALLFDVADPRKWADFENEIFFCESLTMVYAVRYTFVNKIMDEKERPN